VNTITNITYILYLRLCTRIILSTFIFCFTFFFQRYLSFIFNISLFYANISARIIIIIIIKHAIEIEATPDRLSSFHRTQLTRVYHVSNDVHCRTRKRQQLTSARGFRGRPRKGLQTMGRDGKGSRIITVQAPPSRDPFERLLSSVCVHMHDHLCEYIVEWRGNAHKWISNYLSGPDNTFLH